MAVKTTIFPKACVEGLIAEALSSVHSSFLELMTNYQMKKIDNARATWAITYGEVVKVLQCLEPYTDASLAPKHWMARDIFKEMKERMDRTVGIQDAKNVGNKNAVHFARDLTEFMQALHNVLHDKRTDAQRRTHMGVFTGDVVDLDPVTGTMAHVEVANA
jgi:hypothetical protein